MNQVRALSIDVHFEKMVQQVTEPILIHSVFIRTINIIVENNLYTIASNQLDNAPATLLIDLKDFKPNNYLPNDPVSLSNGKLELSNDLSIDLNSANSWRSELPSYPIRQNRLRHNLSTAMKFVIEMGKADWLREEGNNQTLFYKEMGRMLRERTLGLMKKFEVYDPVEQVKQARGLIGLGQGLTPSGDDFLVGMMLAFSTVKEKDLNKQIWSSQVAEVAKTSTNLISYSALKYASNGETRESIGSLFEALFSKQDAEVKHELKNVMQIGSSSGTEISWGIINGLKLLLKQEVKNDNTNKD